MQLYKYDNYQNLIYVLAQDVMITRKGLENDPCLFLKVEGAYNLR